MSRDKFLMIMTAFICVAIVVNTYGHKDTSMVRDLMAVIAFWMPSPMSGTYNPAPVQVPPHSIDPIKPK